MSDFLSFHLPDEFIDQYRNRPVEWGFDVGGGNSLGEIVFLSKYSRLKEDGTKERWHEVCERCINGMYSILKDHVKDRRTPWNEFKAQAAAKDAYERMFTFKWTPPGRGLWVQGSEFLMKNGSASAQNCAALSTAKLSTHSLKEATYPFVRLMDMSMLGIGVGLDCAGAGKLQLHRPNVTTTTFVIPDSREGWSASVEKCLEQFFFKNRPTVVFDYSQIRPAGQPIKGFGGVSGGPDALKLLHESLAEQLGNREGDYLTSRDIVDIANKIGKCVVSAGTRRTAEIIFGDPYDEDFLDLKNFEKNPERMGPDGWGFASNNSVIGQSGEDYSHLASRIAMNGEPGIFWRDIARKYGRLGDPPDYRDSRVTITNPCFSYDTMVAVADGRGAVAIGELAESGADVPVYSMDPDTGIVEIKWGRHPRLTGTDREMVRVHLDDGSHVDTTLDHKFLLRDGSTKLASELEPNDSLARFSKRQEKMSQGNPHHYWRVYTNTRDTRKGKIMEHRLVAQFHEPEKWNQMYDSSRVDGWQRGGLVVHHKDFNPLNNSPDNLEIMNFKDHRDYHAKLADMSGEKNPMFGRSHSEETKRKIGQKTRERTPEQRERQREGIRRHYSEHPNDKPTMEQARRENARLRRIEHEHQVKKSSLNVRWSPKGAPIVIKSCEMCGNEFEVSWGFREQAYCSHKCVGDIESRKQAARQAYIDKAAKTREDQISAYLTLRSQLGRKPLTKEVRAYCRKNNIPFRFQAEHKTTNPNVFHRYSELVNAAEDFNHRVVSVEKIPNADVYNITVDDCHTVGIITSDKGNRLDGIITRQCGEQPLEGESAECCTLCETFPLRHETLEDYKQTLKQAYLYGKTVTLMSTHWPETNEVMQRNLRIGTSMSGVAQFAEERGWMELRRWMNEGYETLRERDKRYSEWLGVRESIRISTVKPSGTTSLLCASTPGVHWPVASHHYIRRMRFSHSDPILSVLVAAGYHAEPDVMNPTTTSVVDLPTVGPQMRNEREVSMWEKTELAVLAQRYWSDNSVSVTVTFREDEKDQIAALLRAKDGQLKSLSMLPLFEDGTAYAQSPYEAVSDERFEEMTRDLQPLDWETLYSGTQVRDAEGERFCTTERCELPQ